ncbi:acetyl-CoA C-acyltransferase [Pararhodobacter zhoushanensis]|uniref:Acetyl-CoA C-acyltransferase n=1 Tax=Pararhodobacter zhoushanensis TaxID=2479545 RepID=A0ABT3GTG2_9RHOB|nr:acetyl-CoA C-acyltransferase [Pararhodobacter zhoushanensis]MCW1930799.1 acetyl-CoA C-acyltransferase [Pararhodobacter zhoushanensis]
MKPVDLLAAPLRALADRHGHHPLADAIFGCVTQTAEQGANIGKLGLIAAGYPDAVPGLTINRYCASGITAVGLAALRAQAADGLAIGGGVESMSRVPMASDKGALTHDFDFQKAAGLIPIGISADAVATAEGFSRADCDAFAAESQRRAVAARESGAFASLVPVGEVTADETPRAGTSAEGLAALAPAFAEMGEKYGLDAAIMAHTGLVRIEHVHHAGNSPAMADGASAVLLGTAAAAERAGLKPRARILAVAELSVDRVLALTGSVEAAQAALAKAGLTADDIDLFEVNESFAALALHFARHMDVPLDRLNVNGGAIALGHAMGSTGAALIGTALDALERRGEKRALIAACGAAGLASALIIERIA